MSDHLASGTDGYRVHVNPDGSTFWLEGHSPEENPFPLDDLTGIKIDNCCSRRGLTDRLSLHFLPEGSPILRLRALRRIIFLEREYSGEISW